MNHLAPETHVDDVESWSGKDRDDENFPVGSFLISGQLRPHVHAYYAFARNADDIADSSDLLPEEKVARLNVMEAVLLGQRDHGAPSAVRLRQSLALTRINPAHATDLLIAFRQDAIRNRYETFDELYNYCRYSAVPVGRYMIDLHEQSPRCYGASDALCISLQILNHLQDCAEDMRLLDRCYIPQTLMRHFNVKPLDLLRPAETPQMRRVFITILDRIDRLNLAAEDLPGMVRDRRLRAEVACICSLSVRLARRLSRHDPLAGRVALSKWDGLMSVMRGFGAFAWR